MNENKGELRNLSGKTQGPFNIDNLGYDYNHAISEATRLWNQLKERHAARGWKYPPRDAAFEHLMSAWRVNPGKAVVHLFDLPNFVHVSLDSAGMELLRKEWWKLVAEYGFREAAIQHEAIYQTALGDNHTTSICELRKLAIERNLSFDEHVVRIRPGANGKPFRTKLPLRIDTEIFGELFGFYGDLIHQKLQHTTKDKELQDKFVRTVNLVFGGESTTSKTIRGEYHRTYSTTMMKHIFNIVGIDTSVRQLQADNAAPLFLFTAPDQVVQGYLRILFECEGGPSYNEARNAPGSVDLHQAILCTPPDQCTVPRHPGRISFRQIGSPETLLATPPRLLVASSLLLVRLNISNRLWPADLYTNEFNEQVMRWRLMITGPDIKTYKSQIGFITTRKQHKLS